jgi:hypothetical protein
MMWRYHQSAWMYGAEFVYLDKNSKVCNWIFFCKERWIKWLVRFARSPKHVLTWSSWCSQVCARPRQWTRWTLRRYRPLWESRREDTVGMHSTVITVQNFNTYSYLLEDVFFTFCLPVKRWCYYVFRKLFIISSLVYVFFARFLFIQFLLKKTHKLFKKIA